MQVLQMQMEVRPDPAEVGRARRWARSRLARSGVAVDEPLAETLILLISELVTNAVVHTGCPAVLRMLFPAGCAAGSPAPDGTAPAAGPDGTAPAAGGTAQRPGGTAWPPGGAAYRAGGAAGWPPPPPPGPVAGPGP
ncbi:ATP-binding protein, partial [Streptomyces sp. HSW2009]|uniref:ATP-binding protein n=1 Tax=Streptomyces sp. HSW2009 TaxID=3142890 RepID=UPI0032EC24DD